MEWSAQWIDHVADAEMRADAAKHFPDSVSEDDDGSDPHTLLRLVLRRSTGRPPYSLRYTMYTVYPDQSIEDVDSDDTHQYLEMDFDENALEGFLACVAALTAEFRKRRTP